MNGFRGLLRVFFEPGRFEPGRTVTALLVMAGFFLLWELGCRVFEAPVFILPSPSVIVARFAEDPALFAEHTFSTLRYCLTGFFLAFVVGLLAAIGIVYSKFLENTLYTLLVALNSIPKITLAPLFIIWMGTGSAPKVAVSMTIALWAVVIDAVLGLRSVEPEALDMARSMRASRLPVLWKIRFPAALPAIFAGTKVAISMALVGVIVGEFVTTDVGLGFAIMWGQGNFDIPMVYVSIVILGIMGTLLFYLIDTIERWVIPWHVSQRSDTVGHGGA